MNIWDAFAWIGLVITCSVGAFIAFVMIVTFAQALRMSFEIQNARKQMQTALLDIWIPDQALNNRHTDEEDRNAH